MAVPFWYLLVFCVFLLKLTTTWSILGTKAMEKCQQWCFALAIAADDVMFGDLVPGFGDSKPEIWEIDSSIDVVHLSFGCQPKNMGVYPQIIH